MNEPNIIWRILRSLLFVFGAGLIIFIQIVPNPPTESPFCITLGYWKWCPQFLQAEVFFHHWLFVWCAAFIHRRPGSTNDLALFLVALVYAVYVDEGLAFGAFALVAMVTILRRLREFTTQQPFVIEMLLATIIYLVCIITKNIVLALLWAPRLEASEIIPLAISFLISYPMLNFIIVLLVRSKKERGLVI